MLENIRLHNLSEEIRRIFHVRHVLQCNWCQSRFECFIIAHTSNAIHQLDYDLKAALVARLLRLREAYQI